MIIKVKIHYTTLRIYIDNILHLSIKQEELIGFQSYIMGTQDFFIEFYMKNGPIIECKYTKKEIWIEILNQLDKITTI